MLPLELPINNVSFGQVSIAFCRELFKRGEMIRLFPIQNQISLSSHNREIKEFGNWLNNAVRNADYHKKRDPIFKLWHLHSGGLSSYSHKQLLYTFYELDSPTESEISIIKDNDMVAVSSEYTKEVFNSYGANNVEYVPLGLDTTYFYPTPKKDIGDDRIVFNVVGKFEKRKHHKDVIRAWVKRFGNNPKYSLRCATYNVHLNQQDNEVLIAHILEGQKYNNVKFFPPFVENEAYNDFLNQGDIILGMSGGEGWGLPEFQSVAVGKHAVILNASGYKGWANSENSVLVEPNGKTSAIDGMFFKSGTNFNQGNIFTFDNDEFVTACEVAITRVETNRVNLKGLELKDRFSYSKMVDNVINLMNRLK